MIAKRIDMRDAAKSRATRLAKYVTDELGRTGRVAAIFTKNCISEDALLAAKEIEICQAKNTRAKDDKTYHLLLSFPDGERPDGERLQMMADAAASALGYGEHQRIAVVHDDTDNLHMHLIINKIHPARLTIHTPRRDFRILAEICMKLERENALQPTNHQSVRSAGENKARDMEAHSGLEGFLSYTRKKIPSIVSVAQSWEELHRALAEAGVSLRLKGNGLVMVDRSGCFAVKASTVGRDLSKVKLEKRLGKFAPFDASHAPSIAPTSSPDKARSVYRKSPASGTSHLYQKYRLEQDTARQERKKELAALWQTQKKGMQRIAAAPKLVLPKAISPSLKRALRLQARTAASTKIAELRRSMAERRKKIKTRHMQRGYIEWLKLEAADGNVSAIYALRERGEAAPALVNITARDLRNAKLIAAKISHVTGRGTLFYRTGHDVFRDTGSHVSLKRDVSDEGVAAALRIAMVKFNGQPLTVNGSDEFKRRCVAAAAKAKLPITFSDAHLELARQEWIQSTEAKPTVFRNDEKHRLPSEPGKSTIPKENQHRGQSR